LAEALGKFPHEIDEMPYQDFIGFMIKSRVSPLHTHRADNHHALLMWLIAKVNSDPKKFNQSPADFAPFKSESSKTDEEIENAIITTLSRV